ncbi:Potassium efflux system KefA protein / Small-conductance mechanosensitive channel [Halanaerobium saccharolyticum subsp. saccharolyticum DSM 6643]|uniref:Potassium efflux system KefA protein / Small-conductance mechanosensitive channel n=1 Tax=Halanaerobium saccharolyticum subsp. saccharolyticum DSM 6643 TaxID=1293054 RepID=M5DZ85_9FIRM|nr:mechanosensitive ion channel domain-containing protein [Halanaerobium saccharolyticum]CCU78595.1 Potassium efflux system KefA protein / Small-conductance mechanosensitive channel [Halanaerobium saccharolyticum subsp. saccharolyticum DSM 6643]
MYIDFIISVTAFTIIYFILLYSTRFILKDLSEKRYKQIRENLKIPLLLTMLNISLLIPFYYLTKSNNILNFFNHFLKITLIFLISWFIIKLMRLIRLYLDDTHRIDSSNNLRARKIHTQYRILERVIKVLIIFIAVAAALMTFDSIKRVGISLFASAGVASIIIGFSAQKIIASIIAGIQLAIAQPIRVQDVVIVNGEWGWIEEINLTYVVVKVWDRRRLVVPTTYFIDNIFQNWTRKSSFILGTVFLYTDYTISVDAIREELDRLLEDNKLWDGKVKVVQVTDASEKTMELRILVSADDSPTAWELRVFLREKLIKFIQDNYPESLPKTRVEFPESQ